MIKDENANHLRIKEKIQRIIKGATMEIANTSDKIKKSKITNKSR